MTWHILLFSVAIADTYISLSIGGDNEPNESFNFSVLLKNGKAPLKQPFKIYFGNIMLIIRQNRILLESSGSFKH